MHIFNPSAIALAIFSVVLLATNGTQISWAEEVSVSLGRPPYIYLWIFAVGMVVQSLFSVTLVTLWPQGAGGAESGIHGGDGRVLFRGFDDSDRGVSGTAFAGDRSGDFAAQEHCKVIFGAMYGAAVFGL